MRDGVISGRCENSHRFYVPVEGKFAVRLVDDLAEPRVTHTRLHDPFNAAQVQEER